MFKVTTSGLLAYTQPCPLVSDIVDDALRDARPCVNEAPLQVVGVADGRLVQCTHVLASNPRSGSRPGLDPDC